MSQRRGFLPRNTPDRRGLGTLLSAFSSKKCQNFKTTCQGKVKLKRSMIPETRRNRQRSTGRFGLLHLFGSCFQNSYPVPTRIMSPAVRTVSLPFELLLKRAGIYVDQSQRTSRFWTCTLDSEKTLRQLQEDGLRVLGI